MGLWKTSCYSSIYSQYKGFLLSVVLKVMSKAGHKFNESSLILSLFNKTLLPPGGDHIGSSCPSSPGVNPLDSVVMMVARQCNVAWVHWFWQCTLLLWFKKLQRMTGL